MAIKQLAQRRSLQCFVVPETVPGELAYPSAEHAIALNEVPESTQERERVSSPEIVYSRSVISSCNKMWKAGEFGMEIILHSCGTPGAPPIERHILNGLFGTVEITPGVDCTYKPAMDKPTYSVWYKVGHTAFALSGVVFGTGTFTYNPSDKGCYFGLAVSGGFMRKRRASSCVTTADLAGDVLTVGAENSKLYSVGMKVQIESPDGTVIDNDSSDGYIITAVDTVNGTLTLDEAPAAAHLAGDIVAPFMPDGSPIAAELPAKTLGLYKDSTFFKVTSATVTFADNAIYPEDEVTESEFPEAFWMGERKVSFNLKMYCRPETIALFYDAENNADTHIALLPKVGTPSGHKLAIHLYRCKQNVPIMSPEGEVMALELSGDCIATAGEDEMTLTYS